MVANLSLAEILETVRQTGRIDPIAVQRAYANGSDPRLAIMRGEINELGIAPVQVFGFSTEPKKNAADIQLAIEAVVWVHVRPALEVFVIVSGDGGFASLGKSSTNTERLWSVVHIDRLRARRSKLFATTSFGFLIQRKKSGRIDRFVYQVNQKSLTLETFVLLGV